MARLENDEVAAVFHEMADLLHIQGGNPHRIRAFSRSARVIETLPDHVETMIRFGTFQKAPGIGEGTVHRVKQILRTGTCDEHARLRRSLPAGLREMLEVKGLGARTVRVIWSNLRIGTVEELEAAARSGALRGLPRMGQLTIERILRGIEAHKKRVGRFPYVESRRTGHAIVEHLQEIPAVQRIALGGSLRRGKATVGDLDVLVASDDPLAVASRFQTHLLVDEVLVRGSGRCSVRLQNRQQVDLRVLPIENWGAGLHYFTGSQLHNIAIRARGLKVAGLKISDKGIFVRDTEILVHPGHTEEDIFAAVGLPWIAPELRENTGEVEAAAAGRLPRLVKAEDLRGDLHLHTVASDGTGTVLDMAHAAVEMGHAYIAITDHSKSLEVANGLDERRLLAQGGHIRQIEDRLGALRIATGTEVDILADGSLDLDLDVLRRLDFVIASVHSAFDMDGARMTDRLIAAMETGVVDVVGHPSNRRLDHRSASELDLDRLLKAARNLGVALEVNGNPYRMDLDDVACRRAREAGVPLCINTDSHSPGHLRYQEFGLLTARRGWVEPKDVLNTQPWEVLADRRRDRFRTRGWSVQAPAPEPAPAYLEPAEGADTAEHYPPMPGDTPPPRDVEASRYDSRPPESPEDLKAELVAPLAPALRERVERWLREGGDPVLEEALAALGVNPMQAAFALLMGSQGDR